MKVLILGAGPSGMMAAHAASQCGVKVVIYDKAPDQSRRNSGVYYLHNDCDLLLDKHEIRQTVLGAQGMSDKELARAYGLKVYGKEIEKTSIVMARNQKLITAYNSGQAIQRLWDLYGGCVEIKEIVRADLFYLADHFDYIVSTIPAPGLFPDNEYFFEKAWVKVGKAPDRESFVFYNVNQNCRWYRCSAFCGAFTQEYGFDIPIRHNTEYEYRTVQKVIGTRDPLPNYPFLLCSGRFGAWDKTFLTDSVYYHVINWLEKRNKQ